MEQKKVSISVEETLYYLLFTLILFTKGIGLEESTLLFRGCLLVSIFLLACKFIVGKYSMAEIIAVGALSAWGTATFFITGSLGMLIYVILIIGMKNINVRSVFGIGASVWGICMCLSFIAAIFFDRTGVRLVHEKLGMGPLLRESMGYTHPNVLHITYIVFMAFILYLYKGSGKKLIGVITLLLLGDMYVFMYSLSYTGLLISGVYLVCFCYFSFRRKISKVECLLIQCILPGCIMISVALPQLIGTGIAYKILNGLLNNRIWAIKAYFTDYAMTLFGRSSEGITFSIDNSYVNGLMGYGIIPWCIIMLVYACLIRYCLKNDMRSELAIICAFLFAGLSEPFLFNASVKNITVIFIGKFLYDTLNGTREIVCVGGKWNRTLNMSGKIRGKMKEAFGQFHLKGAVVTTIVLFTVFFGGIFRNRNSTIEYVYADEKLCHCDGELVKLSEADKSEKSIFIGEQNEDTNYYFFTEENSYIIDVMEFRFRCSISLYIALTCGIAIGFIRKDMR